MKNGSVVSCLPDLPRRTLLSSAVRSALGDLFAINQDDHLLPLTLLTGPSGAHDVVAYLEVPLVFCLQFWHSSTL